MAKLFVVGTPLQMLTSQLIIRQEKLDDAVLLESYFSVSPKYVDSYDMCRIDSLWSKRLDRVVDFPSWDNSGIDILHTAKRTWNRYCHLRKLLEENDVDTIFLADYQNQTFRFMTILFSRLGYRINFYEEGYSHYVPRPCRLNVGVVAKIKEWILDFGYYLPIYRIRFAKWRNNPNRPYVGLPINRRYSIVPGFLTESFDVQLKCEPLVSNRLRGFLSDIVNTDAKERRALLLSDPMTEVLNKEFRYLYFDVLKGALSKLDKDVVVYVKFHPRENEKSIRQHIELMESLNVSYRTFPGDVNVPVEYILLYTQFDRIIFFNTSTYFYNGYLFPKCMFHKLLPSLLEKARQAGAPDDNIRQIELLNEKMEMLKND